MSAFPKPRAFLALIVLCLITHGAAGTASAAGPEAGDRAFSHRVETPRLQFESRTTGFTHLELEGFDARESPLGAPDLPTRTIMVAIPAGSVPRLEFTTSGTRILHRRKPVPRVKTYAGPPSSPTVDDHRKVALKSRPAIEYRPDPAYYASEGTYPFAAAWLGEIGVLRDQRYVVVHLAPVRYDGVSEGLVVDSAIDFTVHFDGGRAPAAVPAEESRFEGVYRKAFANYSQGRRFRISKRDLSTEIRSARAATAQASTASSDSGPRRRLRVRENGLLRLDHAFLQAHAPEFLSEPVSNWKLSSQGVQVPLEIHQISGGGFDDTLIDRPGEYVQFYGQAMDLEPVSEFISDDGGVGDLLYEARDFTDENIYFLTVEPSAQPTVPERDVTPDGQPVAGPYFYDTVHEEADEYFWPYAEQDLYYDADFITENNPIRTDSIALPGLYSTTLPVNVRVHLRGAIQCRIPEELPDKKTGVSLANDTPQELQLPASDPNNIGNVNIGIFDGNQGYTHVVEWLHEPGDPEVSDPLRVSTRIYDSNTPCDDPGGEFVEDVLLDWIEVDYPRSFVAADDTLLFTWTDGPSTVFEIGGFRGPVEIYEISQVAAGSYIYDAVSLTGAQLDPHNTAFRARFRMDEDPGFTDGTKRRFVVTAASAIPTPDPSDFVEDRVSELISDTTQADLVVVAHPDVIVSYCSESLGPCKTDNDCGNGESDRCQLDASSELAELMAWRESQGIGTRLARVPDVEDEFNHGLPGPLAIRNFIAWLLAGGWEGEPPSYVLLVGDSSYDYKAGTANGTYTPTMLVLKTDDILAYYASDNLLASVIGDDFLPDLAIGRIPIRTPEEGDPIFQKIREYDEFQVPGSWRSNVLVMSDRGKDYDPNEAAFFEEMNADAITRWLLGTAYTSQNLRFWSDYCSVGSCSPAQVHAMHDDIIAGINGDLTPGIDGAVLAQYVGHGNFDLWSDSVFFCANEANAHPYCAVDDTLSLFNDDEIDPQHAGGMLPWLLVHNCLTGGFHGEELKSMGEQWVKRAGGGAIAVLAPSGLGFRYVGTQVIEEVWGSLFGPHKERDIAVPVMDTLVRLCIGTLGNPSPETCQYHVLLGDPSMRLALPHIDPAESLQAVPGNAQVSLSWSPSATPDVQYAVYRARVATSAGGLEDYVLAGTTSNLSIVDSGVDNAQTYVYYVVALDADGFESAWSNFNTTCAEDPPGEDCVAARPLNLVPPVQPSAGQAIDQETGGKLHVSWPRNPEGDIDFYTLHYGTSPALGQIMTGLNASIFLHGLENDELHHFRVTATNTSGVTSVLSEEFTGRPTLKLGVRSPGLVGDLVLDREDDDAVLIWSPVTTDIYDGPVVVGEYEVFRGELAQFVPGTENKIGSTIVSEFTDPGAAAAAEPDYFYLVRALDVIGNPGGLGRQLPVGIDSLLLAPSETPGWVVLSWSPVTLDFDQQPTQISHYELYASDEPFGRAEIQAGSVDLIDGAIPGQSIEVQPVTPNRYYSVLAVDVRGNRSPY